MVNGTGLWAGVMAGVVLGLPAAAQEPSLDLAAAIADSTRPTVDRARDADRKPAQLIAFAGLKPGDRIAELIPLDGYFTRIFAKLVRPDGHVYAITPVSLASRGGLIDQLSAVAANSPNVTVRITDYAKIELPEQLDMIWISENTHDMYGRPGFSTALINKAVFNALKPGGIFLIEDFQAAPGGGTEAAGRLHRIEPEIVIRDVEAAGFKLDARSDVLANPSDPHTANVYAPEIRGRTDRFVLRFRKPR